MHNAQLLDYIKEQRQCGVSRESIKEALLASGWPELEIDQALSFTCENSNSSDGMQNVPVYSSSFSYNFIIQETLRRFKKIFLRWLILCILMAVFFIGLSILYFMLLNNSNNEMLAFIMLLFLIIGFIVGSVIFRGIECYLIQNYNNPEKLKIADVWRGGVKICVRVSILVMLLWLCVQFGSLFIIPGILISLMYFVALPVLVHEKDGIIHAFAKSSYYMRGYKLKMFFLLLLTFVIYMFFYLMLMGVRMLIGGLFGGWSYFIVLSVLMLALLVLMLAVRLFFLIMPFVVYDTIKSAKTEKEVALGAEKETLHLILSFILPCLLFLVVIVVIIVSIFLFSITSNRKNAQDAALKSKVSRIQTSLMIYQDVNDKYPKNLEELCRYNSFMCLDEDDTNIVYKVSSGGNSYKLCATLSDKTDFCVEE